MFCTAVWQRRNKATNCFRDSRAAGRLSWQRFYTETRSAVLSSPPTEVSLHYLHYCQQASPHSERQYPTWTWLWCQNWLWSTTYVQCTTICHVEARMLSQNHQQTQQETQQKKRKKVDFSSSSGLRSMTIMCSINGAARARRVAYIRYIHEEEKKRYEWKIEEVERVLVLWMKWNGTLCRKKQQLCTTLRVSRVKSGIITAHTTTTTGRREMEKKNIGIIYFTAHTLPLPLYVGITHLFLWVLSSFAAPSSSHCIFHLSHHRHHRHCEYTSPRSQMAHVCTRLPSHSQQLKSRIFN